MPSAYVTSAGGCSSNTSGASCADQGSFVVNVNDTVETSFDGCPAPRVGPGKISVILWHDLRLITKQFWCQTSIVLRRVLVNKL